MVKIMVSKETYNALIQDTLKLIKKDLNSNNQELKEYAKEQLDKLIAEGVIDDKLIAEGVIDDKQIR